MDMDLKLEEGSKMGNHSFLYFDLITLLFFLIFFLLFIINIVILLNINKVILVIYLNRFIYYLKNNNANL